MKTAPVMDAGPCTVRLPGSVVLLVPVNTAAVGRLARPRL